MPCSVVHRLKANVYFYGATYCEIVNEGRSLLFSPVNWRVLTTWVTT